MIHHESIKKSKVDVLYAEVNNVDFVPYLRLPLASSTSCSASARSKKRASTSSLVAGCGSTLFSVWPTSRMHVMLMTMGARVVSHAGKALYANDYGCVIRKNLNSNKSVLLSKAEERGRKLRGR